MPAIAASPATIMKLMILTRSGLIPSARAARPLPPTANIQLPNLVRSRTIQKTITSPRNQKTEVVMNPRSPARIVWYGRAWSLQGKGQPFEMRRTMPLRIIIEPRVVMKEGIRSFVVTMPLRAPTPTAAARGRKNATKGFQ